jgi:hypothetical protein
MTKLLKDTSEFVIPSSANNYCRSLLAAVKVRFTAKMAPVTAIPIVIQRFFVSGAGIGKPTDNFNFGMKKE